MRNRYKGICEICGKMVLPRQGRFRIAPKLTQNFTGLRCIKCSTTTKVNLKSMKQDILNEIETYKQGIEIQKEIIENADKNIEQQRKWISECEAKLKNL